MADLSTGRFTILLTRLDSDRTKAAEKYVGLRHKLVKIFERTQCSDPDALADEALDRLAKKIEDEGNEEVISNLSSFAYGVAHKISLESHRHSARFVSIDSHYENADSVIGDPDPEARILESMRNAHDAECLDRCLGKLMTPDRQLLLDYYKGEKQVRIRRRQGLAAQLGIDLPALRRHVNRLREKLRVCMHRCLKTNLKVNQPS